MLCALNARVCEGHGYYACTHPHGFTDLPKAHAKTSSILRASTAEYLQTLPGVATWGWSSKNKAITLKEPKRLCSRKCNISLHGVFVGASQSKKYRVDNTSEFKDSVL